MAEGIRRPFPPLSVTGWQRETLPTDLAAMADCNERFSQTLKAAGVADADLFAIKLALEEALANAVKHGNQQDPAKSVYLHYLVEAGRVAIIVEDEGPGFSPEDVPDCTADENIDKPNGRGIMLIRNFMDHVDYAAGGRQVRMVKELSEG